MPTKPEAETRIQARERDLVQRAQQHDPEAMNELVKLHQGRIYGLLCHMTGHPTEAEDLAQETFLRAYRALPRFRGKASFFTWLYRIAVNTAINHLRRKRRSSALSLDDDTLGIENDPALLEWSQRHAPSAEAGRLELQKKLNEALHSLSEKHRAVVVLHDVEGWSHEDIARMLRVSVGTVRSRLFYARRLLQVELKDFKP